MKNSLMNKIVIVDYGLGNIRSIKHKLEKYNYTVSLSNKANEIESAGLLILPGVGNFSVTAEINPKASYKRHEQDSIAPRNTIKRFLKKKPQS